MGACLGKLKRNSVSPSAAEESIRERMLLQTSAKHREPDPINPADMIKQLKDAEIKESRITTGGSAFALSLRGDPSRMPARLADRLDSGNTHSNNNREVKYTAEEKELLAELLRNDILRERSEKARKCSAKPIG